MKRNFPLVQDAMDLNDEAAMTREVQEYKDSGGDSMVELSVPGIRLDVEAVRRISEKTGVHVIPLPVIMWRLPGMENMTDGVSGSFMTI